MISSTLLAVVDIPLYFIILNINEINKYAYIHNVYNYYKICNIYIF